MSGSWSVNWFVLVIYFLGMFYIGYRSSKKVKSGSDYILAGRQLPLYLVIGGIFATWVNSGSLLGYGGTGYTVGISGYFINVGYLTMCIWMGFWFIKKLRRTGVTTIPEFFEIYYGAPGRIISLVLVFCRDMAVTAAVSVGMATVFMKLFSTSLDMALFITLCVVVVYTVIGGMWAVMITDFVQALIILLGTLIIIPMGIAKIGGWSAFVAAVPPAMTNPFSVGWLQITAWLFIGAFTTAGYQTMIQRGLSADTDNNASKAFIYGGVISAVWYFIPYVIGMITKVLYPNIAASEAYLTIISIFPPFILSVMVVAIIAGSMSTVDSTILTMSSNITVDIYKRFINPNASEKQVVLISRCSVLFLAVFAVLLARALPFILELFFLGGRIMAAGMAPVLLAALFWKKARQVKIAPCAAMVVGATLTTYWQFFGAKVPAGGPGAVFLFWTFDPILMGIPACVIVLVAGVLIEKHILDKKAAEAA